MNLTISNLTISIPDSDAESLLLRVAKALNLDQAKEAPKNYFNQEEAANYLGVSRNTLTKFVEQGLPVMKKSDRRYIYSRKEIDQWIYQQQARPHDRPQLKVIK